MPQLDLFGTPVNPQPEKKQADKTIAAKGDDVLKTDNNNEESFTEAARHMLGANKIKSRSQSDKNEDTPVSEQVPKALSLFENSLSKLPEEAAIEESPFEAIVISVNGDSLQKDSELQRFEERGELVLDDEVFENGVEEDAGSATVRPSSVNDEVVAEKDDIAPVAQALQAEPVRNGKVIYDDGNITVKIKAKQTTDPAPVIEKKTKEKVIKLPQKRGRKSIKEIDVDADLIEVPEDEILFQKQYYPISEVAGWFKVNTSLLRFWENEFDVLKPRKNRKGDRLFRPEDVKSLQLIHHLLRQRKYTIEGAKEYIKLNRKKADLQMQLTHTLQKFRSFLLDLKANLQP